MNDKPPNNRKEYILGKYFAPTKLIKIEIMHGKAYVLKKLEKTSVKTFFPSFLHSKKYNIAVPIKLDREYASIPP